MIVKCQKCGGNVEVARLRTSEHEIELTGAFSLQTSRTEARVCMDCGYTEVYAMQPRRVAGVEEEPEEALTMFDE